MGEPLAIRREGAAAARSALERCIAAGGVAVFPADGLYGLACDPLDPEAIERIHRIKGRDARASPRRSCISRRWRCASCSAGSALAARAALAALLPGPVTLVIANPSTAIRSPAARIPSGSASA